MSLRIAPAAAHPSQTNPHNSAPSAPGVHDTLRANLGLTAAINPSSSQDHLQPLQSSHPLEARLTAWRATQDNLKMQMLRRQYGIAEPVRRGMEMKIVQAGEWRPAALGASAGVHSDILAGRDAEVGWEDVFTTGAEMRDGPDFHTEMEHKLKMHS
ncbi:proteasome maturation factor UMP1 [Pseudovirgaria hyperparasitica]|uniref:Proteasome maturation factor UMP1 n=1 Tax=Pseudovirgaria hyperparasitica TaxID=470096 RepID=A0A6A6WJ51_9PEZI|nr:proteasome maturation factor UMP1 [Pseudovirgaria hyperparasitica]KAF2761767.1 proteasome maturation factor UMP1 [Pseudovirgaria hyperparasitica]